MTLLHHLCAPRAKMRLRRMPDVTGDSSPDLAGAAYNAPANFLIGEK